MTVAVVSLVPPGPSVRLLTVADLAALPSELPSGPVLYELDHGRLVIRALPGDVLGAGDRNNVPATARKRRCRLR